MLNERKQKVTTHSITFNVETCKCSGKPNGNANFETRPLQLFTFPCYSQQIDNIAVVTGFDHNSQFLVKTGFVQLASGNALCLDGDF